MVVYVELIEEGACVKDERLGAVTWRNNTDTTTPTRQHQHANTNALSLYSPTPNALFQNSGAYMVNWSPKLGTAVSDLEVEYSEEPGFLYHFK